MRKIISPIDSENFSKFNILFSEITQFSELLPIADNGHFKGGDAFDNLDHYNRVESYLKVMKRMINKALKEGEKAYNKEDKEMLSNEKILISSK